MGDFFGDWIDISNGHLMDGVYTKMRHLPCDTVVYAANGDPDYCPKCHPEEWEKYIQAIELEKKQNVEREAPARAGGLL